MTGKTHRVERQSLTANDVVLRHLWLEVIEDGTQSRLQTVKQVYPKSGRPRIRNLVGGGARKRALPASQGPEIGTLPMRSVNSVHLLRHVKGLLRAAQACTATAQGCLLMARVKTASAQAWKRNWHLVRSFFADDYIAILTKQELQKCRLGACGS
jgi:hypothetical protein